MKMNRNLESHFDSLSGVFEEIGREYDRLAGHYDDFSCQGCQDNCCTTVFSHYTLIEYLYLLKGFETLPWEQKDQAKTRAEEYVRSLREHPGGETSLELMCPLNVEGLCGLYQYRPLICRIHGLPSMLRSPARGVQRWDGCLRFQELHGDAITLEMDRTGFYSRIAILERDMRQELGFMQKIKKTIAEMITGQSEDEARLITKIVESGT
jgi:Fe-S-cluster containining protein